MSDKAVGRLAVALAALLVVVLGVIVMTRGSDAGPDASASSSAIVTTSATPLLPSPSASDGAPSASANAAVSPSPSAGTGPASFTLIGLKLDATEDPNGRARIVTFVSEQPGTITVSLSSRTPQGTTHMCLSQGSTEVGCEDWATGTFTRTTSQSNVTWTVTVIGDGIETPVVDVGATFPATSPSVTIEHARFDGTASPDTNGLHARFQARTDGDVRLQADWGAAFTYRISFINEATGTTDVSPGDVPSSGLDLTSIPVQAGTYTLVLENTDAGSGTTDLLVSVGWP